MKPLLHLMIVAGFFRIVHPACAQFGIVYSYDEYAHVLATYVNADGLVNYKGLKADRDKLDFYVRDVAGLYTDLYDRWPEPEKLAFWINAYNALTLRAVVDEYPVKSIKDIGSLFVSVWDKLKFMVQGEMMTLNDIEHRTLRVRFKEPRIHMAINCASLGCPPLRAEPFLAGTLNEQLDDQARRFLADPKKFRIDHAGRTVHLSPLFKWFGEDFAKAFSDKLFVTWGSATEQAVLAFISPYLSENDRKALAAGVYDVKYLGYDWSLNNQ